MQPSDRADVDLGNAKAIASATNTEAAIVCAVLEDIFMDVLDERLSD
jgi:hypothetical protein